MKTLILVRHAKSSWDEIGLADHERPLNERGKKDAPDMAERLKNKNIKIDRFISSPANRAFRTARYFAKAFDLKKKDIKVEQSLYGAAVSEFERLVSELKDKDDVVALFSHNPGITDFANSLCEVRTDNIPTCGIFAVHADVKKWEDFNGAEKKFLFYDYPKKPVVL